MPDPVRPGSERVHAVDPEHLLLLFFFFFFLLLDVRCHFAKLPPFACLSKLSAMPCVCARSLIFGGGTRKKKRERVHGSSSASRCCMVVLRLRQHRRHVRKVLLSRASSSCYGNLLLPALDRLLEFWWNFWKSGCNPVMLLTQKTGLV